MAVRAANQWRQRRGGGLIGRVTGTFAVIGPELHAKLAGVVARNRLPGAVAGVVHRNELAWSAAIGLADVTAGRPAELGTLFRMHRPRYLADDEWTQAWGISWCGKRAADTVWITHSGWVPGFTSSICFDPRSQAGAIVLLNGEYFGSTTELAISLAETARAAGPAQVPGTGTAAKAAPGSCQPLLGLYARPGHTHVVRVEWRDGRLAVAGPEPGGWRFPLSPTSDPEVFTVDPDSPQAGDQVRFHRTADGRVCAVSLFDATFARLDPLVAG